MTYGLRMFTIVETPTFAADARELWTEEERGAFCAWLAAHPLPDTGMDTDKNSRGRVLVAGSSRTVPGAILLTGEAALRAGAGKVQLASVADIALQLGIAMPEAAAFPLPANDAGELAENAGHTLQTYLERCDALVFGPGMGAQAPAAAILPFCPQGVPRPWNRISGSGCRWR